MSDNNENLPVTTEDDPKKNLKVIEQEAKSLDKEYKETVKVDVQSQSMEDFEFARSITYDTIEKLGELFESSVNVAKETEAPRAVEVASGVGKLIIEASHDLMVQQENLIKLAQQVDELAKTTYDEEVAPPVIIKETGEAIPAPQAQVNVSMTMDQMVDMVIAAENAKKEEPVGEIIDVTPKDEE